MTNPYGQHAMRLFSILTYPFDPSTVRYPEIFLGAEAWAVDLALARACILQIRKPTQTRQNHHHVTVQPPSRRIAPGSLSKFNFQRSRKHACPELASGCLSVQISLTPRCAAPWPWRSLTRRSLKVGKGKQFAAAIETDFGWRDGRAGGEREGRIEGGTRQGRRRSDPERRKGGATDRPTDCGNQRM